MCVQNISDTRKIPNTADAEVSIIPEVSVALPLGAGVKLEDRLRGALRVKGLALRTEETYVGWYRRYVKYSGMRHPQELVAREVEGFLTHLTAELNVAAVTQNQALNALRAKRKKYLPVVLTMEEVKRLMEGLRGEDWLRGENNLPVSFLFQVCRCFVSSHLSCSLLCASCAPSGTAGTLGLPAFIESPVEDVMGKVVGVADGDTRVIMRQMVFNFPFRRDEIIDQDGNNHHGQDRQRYS